jgi:hypothetical protein
VPDEALVIAVEPELAMLAGEAEEETEPEADAAVTEEHDADEAVIRGKTTFGDLLGWGLSKDQIEEVLGMPMGARLKAVRDFAFEEGLEFGTVRTALQALLEPDGEPVSE